MRHIPHTGAPLETGLVQHGDHWPGLFIRADEAMAMASGLRGVLQRAHAPSQYIAAAQQLVSLLESCNAANLQAILAAGR